MAFAAPLPAQGGGIEVRPAGRETLASEPRQVVATTFTVRNATGRLLEAEPRLILPPGWQAIASEAPFDLAAGQSATRLVSFMIPEDARAGEYTVTFEVRDRRQRALSDAYITRVQVTAAPKVQVLPLETRDFVIAGESFQSAFLVRNVGNAAIVARFRVRGRRGIRPSPSEGSLALEPGESRRIEIAATTPELRERANARLTVTVEVADSVSSANATSETQIVPRASRLEAFHTLGSRLDMRLVARDAQGKRPCGWQPELSGAGAIDEARSRYLSFRFRGPDMRGRGSFGASDEYWLRYEGDGVVAAAGDFTHGLSRLTDPGRFGRGALLGYAKDSWGISAFEMKDPDSSRPGSQRGLNAFYRVTPATQLDANLLSKSDSSLPGNIVSLRSQTRWADGLDTDMEVGWSTGGAEQGHAVRGTFTDSRHALRYYVLGWTADPQFRGYLRDKEYLSAGFDYPRARGWGLRGYYRLQDWNLEPLEEIDPDLLERQNPSDLIRAAPTQRQASLGTTRPLGANTRVTLDYVLRTRTGGSDSPALDVQSQAWTAGLAQTWRNLSLHYSLERGASRNEISGEQFGTSMHLLSASLRAGRAQTYSLYAMRDENTYSDAVEEAQTSYGLNASYALGSRTSVRFDAQRYRSTFGRNVTYDLSVIHERPEGGRFRLSARRLEGRFERTDLLLSYSVPFALPVVHKANVSALRGRVLDTDTGGGLRNVLLHLDGLTAVTNHRGEFEFPAVKAGSYRMVMDRANLDVSKVPAGGTSLDVTVAANGTQPVQIAMVRAISIAVTVEMHAGDATPARAAPNVLVILKNGENLLRRLTDADGRVRLGGLAPGRWVVSVAGETVPQGYDATARELELDVAPGESVVATIPLSPVRRNIRMLAPMTVN